MSRRGDGPSQSGHGGNGKEWSQQEHGRGITVVMNVRTRVRVGQMGLSGWELNWMSLVVASFTYMQSQLNEHTHRSQMPGFVSLMQSLAPFHVGPLSTFGKMLVRFRLLGYGGPAETLQANGMTPDEIWGAG